MAFHEAYWVAATAAAPVIGLTHVVAVNRQSRQVVAIVARQATMECPATSTRRQRIGEWIVAAFRLAVPTASILAATRVLNDSLTALSQAKDAASMTLDSRLLLIAMQATLLPYIEFGIYLNYITFKN